MWLRRGSPRVGRYDWLVIADTIRERIGDEPPADISAVLWQTSTRCSTRRLPPTASRISEVREAGPNRSVIDLSVGSTSRPSRMLCPVRSHGRHRAAATPKAAIQAQLERLIRVNRTRADYLAKFGELIESYNAGSRNIDDLFKDLVAFSRDLSSAEQQRHVREQLSEGELTVFDLLTRPGPDLSPRRSATRSRRWRASFCKG